MWNNDLVGGGLPPHLRKKEDYVRHLLTEMLNEMVEACCPNVIEID